MNHSIFNLFPVPILISYSTLCNLISRLLFFNFILLFLFIYLFIYLFIFPQQSVTQAGRDMRRLFQ